MLVCEQADRVFLGIILFGLTIIKFWNSPLLEFPINRLLNVKLTLEKVLRDPRGGPENLGRRRVPEVRDTEPK